MQSGYFGDGGPPVGRERLRVCVRAMEDVVDNDLADTARTPEPFEARPPSLSPNMRTGTRALSPLSLRSLAPNTRG